MIERLVWVNIPGGVMGFEYRDIEAFNREYKKLEKYGVDEEVSKSVIDVLDKCEFAQYAPELSGNDMGDVLQHAADVMDQLENTKKKK